jgi:hypothetical protein
MTEERIDTEQVWFWRTRRPGADQIALIDGHVPPMTSLIAMQKIVGSNPISRFRESPARGPAGASGEIRNQIKPSPHIAVIPGTNSN